MRLRCGLLLLLPLLSCSSGAWLFSSERWLDRSRACVLVETQGGVELGCATELGVLTLGRTASTGPCRVHYFVGRTPLIEAGQLDPVGGGFVAADIELKTTAVPLFELPPDQSNRLIAQWTPDGVRIETVAVALATGEAGITGDVLLAPARPLPAGAAILHCVDSRLVEFVGLVSGKATLQVDGRQREYYTFAGLDRLRELLAVPQPYPRETLPKYRVDDITVERLVPIAKPAKPELPPPEDPPLR